MTATTLRPDFLDAVVLRSLEPGAGSLATWLGDLRPQPSGALQGRPRMASCASVLIDRDVVHRGLYRCQGGQADRPEGVSSAAHAEINAADSEQDADLMSPATASILIQVGLFGKVVYP